MCVISHYSNYVSIHASVPGVKNLRDKYWENDAAYGKGYENMLAAG